MDKKYETLLKTLQEVCKLHDENNKLKREIKIYQDLFYKEINKL